MSHWTAGPIAGLDFEATGVDPSEARPIEVSLLLQSPDGVVETLVDTLCDPGVEIPDIVTDITGISRDDFGEGTPDSGEAVARVLGSLSGLADRGIPVAIYNAPYDLPLPVAEASRHGMSVPGLLVVDPLVLDRHLDRYRKGSRKLVDVCAHHGIELDGAHRAGADVEATIALARILLPRLGEPTVDEVHGLQVKAHATWLHGYNRWRRSKGQAPIPTTAWPGADVMAAEPAGVPL